MATHKICDQASLYVLGVLERDELIAYEQHLEQGCAVCEAELNGFQSAVDQLSYGAPVVSPPPALKSKLMTKIQQETVPAQQNQSIDIQTGLRYVKTADEPWQDIQPGIQFKPLYMDQIQGRMTAIARMDPDTTYAAHRHAAAEECYILEGSCYINGELLEQGDYHYAEAGSVHHETRTKDGCLMLIIFSPDNEMLSNHP